MNVEPGRNSINFQAIFFIFFVLVLVVSSYVVTLTSPFQWDDIVLVRDNEIIKNLEHFIHPELAKDYQNYHAFTGGYVTYLSYGLNYYLHGESITGYHIFNIALHTLNVLLVFAFVTTLFKTPYFKKNMDTCKPYNPLVVVLCTLLFALHPIQTEAINYIGQRAVPLGTFFYLISITLFLKFKISDSEKKLTTLKNCILYGSSLICAFLAFKCKPNTATLPLMVTFFFILFFPARKPIDYIQILPFFLLSLIIPIGIEKGGIPLVTVLFGIETETNPVTINSTFIHDYLETDAPRFEYIITQLRVLVTYFRLVLFPVNQNFDYDYPLYNSLFDSEIMLSLLFFLFLIFTLIWSYRQSTIKSNWGYRFITCGIGWIIIALSIESLVRIPMLIAEYRLYLPSIGFFLAMSGIFTVIAARFDSKRTLRIGIPVLIILAIILSLATYHRNSIWKTNVALWTDTVKKSPNKARTRYNLAKYHMEEGNIDEAISGYIKTIELKQNYPEAHSNLANAYRKLEMYDQAISHYKKALEISPRDKLIYNNLGIAFARKKMYEDAINSYLASIRIDPNYVFALNNIGNAYRITGKYDKALEYYQQALKINPNNKVIINNYKNTIFLRQNSTGR